MNVDYITVGKRIRKFRLDKRITQEELAFQIGTSAAYVSSIECGKKKPSLQKLAQISDVLEVTVNDFIYPPTDFCVTSSAGLFEIESCSPAEKKELLTKTVSALINSFITS